jgi:adenylate cyclase
MSQPIQVQIFERRDEIFSKVFFEPIELGRQSDDDEIPFAPVLKDGVSRLVIARRKELAISRRHLLIESAGEGKVRLTNLSNTMPIHLREKRLEPLAWCEESLPVLFVLGEKTLRIMPGTPPPVQLQSLVGMSLVPGSDSGSSALFPTLAAPAGVIADNRAIVRWLQACMGVLQSAASSSDFFTKAALAVVEMVGLDTGQVLLLDENGDWRPEAIRTAAGSESTPDWRASRQVLNTVRAEKKTFWEVPTMAAATGASLKGIKAVVAAPILDRNGRVIGALYGDRHSKSLISAPISEMQAMLVELLAGGVAAGLARLEQEAAAVAARVQFEQFFTPELSRQLALQPDLLKGRDTEVSVLFCDIRGFSRVSERLGPAGTMDWISHVMGTLSECVQAQAGVLVDYIGDELMAMWGAPTEQPEHAQQACRAALAMLECLPQLNERWQPLVGEAMSLGIGINSGEARVGNTGTQHKFKYGPLGNTVNIASRVQGATKYLQTKLLITGGTRSCLDAGFQTRRLCKARVVNIAQAIELYELAPPGEPGWEDLKHEYERGLDEFERKEFRGAGRILGNLLTVHPNDGPTLVLLSRAVQALIDKPIDFSPVWELSRK